jgi:hypothetical protein
VEDEEEDQAEMEGTRAELYHHLSHYYIDKALRMKSEHDEDEGWDEEERRVKVVDGVLKQLDARIRSLSHPHFSAQHLGLLLQQQLNEEE